MSLHGQFPFFHAQAFDAVPWDTHMVYVGVGRGVSVAVAVSQHVGAFDAVQFGVVLGVSVAVVVVCQVVWAEVAFEGGKAMVVCS